MLSRTWRVLALALVCGTGMMLSPHGAQAGDCGLEKQNLKEAAASSGVLSQMMAATKLAGLDEPQADVGPLTLFAPSDEAFMALPEDLRAKLLAPENRDHLAAVLLHHAVPGEFPTARLLNASARHYAVDAIDGTLVEITTRRGLDVAGAHVVRGDIIATDGIIHIIDKVLIPASVLAALDRQPVPTKVAVSSHEPE
jgi:uncharacterized surface protein with fasciclin (FAS1) repeats